MELKKKFLHSHKTIPEYSYCVVRRISNIKKLIIIKAYIYTKI